MDGVFWLFPLGVMNTIFVVFHFAIIAVTIVSTAIGAHRIATNAKLGCRILFAPVFIIGLSLTTIMATVGWPEVIGLAAQVLIALAVGALTAVFYWAARHPERF
jgi:hypothetical protein